MTKNIKKNVAKGVLAFILFAAVFAGVRAPKTMAEGTGYKGITVGDNDYSDWDQVKKYDGTYGADKVAMVWDGYYVYIYLETFSTDYGNGYYGGSWNRFAWAGPNSNGNFSIRTEYGEKILHLGVYNNEPYAEFDGSSKDIEVYVNNKDWNSYSHIWEIKIPTKELPTYKDTISLGYYQYDTLLIADVSNLNMPADLENPGIKEDIVFDGANVDWTNYPHTTIAYATNGTHSSKIDASGALYNSGEYLYGCVETEYAAHTTSGEAAVAFTQAVVIKMNNKYFFYPRFVTVNSSGIINWNPKLDNLAPGEYHYKIFSLDAWASAVSINNLDEHNVCYGDMIITIGSDGCNKCEFQIDSEKLAEKFETEPENIKVYAAQFGRLGQNWITCAGASTAPWIGVAAMVVLVGLGAFLRKKMVK